MAREATKVVVLARIAPLQLPMTSSFQVHTRWVTVRTQTRYQVPECVMAEVGKRMVGTGADPRLPICRAGVQDAGGVAYSVGAKERAGARNSASFYSTCASSMAWCTEVCAYHGVPEVCLSIVAIVTGEKPHQWRASCPSHKESSVPSEFCTLCYTPTQLKAQYQLEESSRAGRRAAAARRLRYQRTRNPYERQPPRLTADQCGKQTHPSATAQKIAQQPEAQYQGTKVW